MKKNNIPDYKKIYADIIEMEYPHKKEECFHILDKENISLLDVLRLNCIIFDIYDSEISILNQQLKAYDEDSIMYILDYQNKNRLTNSEIAIHFKLSMNTLTKWKKLFSKKIGNVDKKL
ncbi:hypothetical protein [Chryseobacterium polytrichastri]|uniref:Helix-turn-helix domain-containing protein n=1 Tax=Chryseobacterium polytrichastri TaxID=1302687 RepID=A0A1M7L666_9FLAO|nr:hypothetical protein [Chryseobacterium polytrichastri]SHM72835.1 hypothetical protein SAMN05444267_10832 [Chryseobacterium polytrichastri]